MSIYQIYVLVVVLLKSVKSGESLQQTTQEASCPIWDAPADNCKVSDYCIVKTDFNCYVWEHAHSSSVCIQAGTCITYDSDNYVKIGLCPYFPPGYQNITTCKLPLAYMYQIPSNTSLGELNSIICGPYNREGLLCSQCKPGYGPAVYAFSLMCVKCTDNGLGWALYFFLVLFPITIFYFIVILFNIQATSPPLMAFIFFCQIYCTIERVSVPLAARLERCNDNNKILLHIVRVLCGIWNLDFFRYLIPPFCASSNLNNIQAMNLDYIIAFYPLVLILCTFICLKLHSRNFKPLVVIWRPLHKYIAYFRRSWDAQASIINAFSTFMFIYYSKVTFTVSNSFIGTKVYKDLKNHSVSLYFEPVDYFHDRLYLRYVIINILIAFLFVLLPIMLLCLYPTKIFRALLQYCLPSRWRFGLYTFIETIQGYYKDGTDGTLDYRAMSGLHLIILVFIVCLGLSVQTRLQYLHLMQALLGAYSLIFALVRPYKNTSSNIIHSLLSALSVLVLLIVNPFMVAHQKSSFLVTILFLCLLLPHAVLIAVVMYKAAKRLGCLSPECYFKIFQNKFCYYFHNIICRDAHQSTTFSEDERTSLIHNC